MASARALGDVPDALAESGLVFIYTNMYWNLLQHVALVVLEDSSQSAMYIKDKSGVESLNCLKGNLRISENFYSVFFCKLKVPWR